MTEILHTLRSEHDDFTKVLDVLEKEVEACKRGGRPNLDIIRDIVDYCRDFAMLCHHPKEDLVYRRLRLATDSAVVNSVGDLLAEHEAFSALTDELETAVENLLSDSAEDRARFVWVAHAFLKRCRNHMKVEDDELFPLAARCLSDKDWTEIDNRAAALEASYPTGAIAERLAALGRMISAHENLQQWLASRDTW